MDPVSKRALSLEDRHLPDSKRQKRVPPSNASILVNEKFTDYLIRTPDRTFKVHRAIVLGHSDFLDAAMTNGCKETNGMLDLPEEQGNVIATLLWYIYTGAYPQLYKKSDQYTQKPRFSDCISDSERWFGTDNEFLFCHVKVMLTADRLMIPSLGYSAHDEMRTALVYSGGLGKSQSSLFSIQDYGDAVTFLWEHDTPSLRKAKNILTSMTVCSVINRPQHLQDLEPLARDIPGFGWSLFVERQGSCVVEFACQDCRQQLSIGTKTFFLVRRGGVFASMDCTCRFRNLCQDGCHLQANLSEIQHSVYCVDCHTAPYDQMCSRRAQYVVETIEDGLKLLDTPIRLRHRATGWEVR